MISDALLDLHALMLPSGAVAAGWVPGWRYDWPRDTSFVAVALAEVGHQDDALAALRFLQSVQLSDGSFYPRVDLVTGRPPDSRPKQSDAPGWVLWATEQVVNDEAQPGRSRAVQTLWPLISSAASRISADLATPSALPAASPDYWETHEKELTLGTVAPLLAGLNAAVNLYELNGRATDAARLKSTFDRSVQAVRDSFGQEGYPRTISGKQPDAAVTFLLEPFLSADTFPRAAQARDAAPRTMERPGGGLAPGAGWKNDGISWTPETGLFALSFASSGDWTAAQAWLRWLDAHRTSHGALPEKVLADGKPASVAPLAWTDALVLLTWVRLRS